MRAENFRNIFKDLKSKTQARAPMIAGDHLAYLLEKPISDVVRNGELLAEGIILAKTIYNPDMVIVFADIAVEAEAMGVRLEYSDRRNPHVVDYPELESTGVIDIVSKGRIPELLKAARICRSEFSADYPIFYSMKDPFSLAALVEGSEKFLTALLEEPSSAKSIIDICVQNLLPLVETVCQEGFIPLVGAPMASGSLIGPRWFERFVEDALNPVFARISELNFPRCMHICGEISPLVRQLPRLDLDLLSVEEWNSELWSLMPDTIPMGYVPTELFVNGSEDSIADAVRNCLDNMQDYCLLSSACDIPANSRPDLVRHFMQAYHQ